MCSCGSSSPNLCDLQLISHIRLQLEFLRYYFSMAPHSDSPAASNLESFGTTHSSRWTRDSSLAVSSVWRPKSWEMAGGCLLWNSIILSISDVFQQSLVIKCMFWSKYSHTAEISTEVAVDHFYVHPGKGNWRRCNRLDPAVKNTVKVHCNLLYVLWTKSKNWAAVTITMKGLTSVIFFVAQRSLAHDVCYRNVCPL